MVTINLTQQEVNRLTRLEVETLLKRDSFFKELKDDYQGKNRCTYLVNDVAVFVFNELGYYTTFLSCSDEIAKVFAIKSYLVLNNIPNNYF